MNTIGIIAEYNPFHNGHAYQIKKARELFHADFVIVAMSGNFVQRGAPAILDKYSRAKTALQNGADLVFEIPTAFAVSSAEYFAFAGVALLDALPPVDAVSFGCETPDLPLLAKMADILANEPDDFKRLLSLHLKNGSSFPSARQKAFTGCQAAKGAAASDLSSLLSSPNNILALEYLKAIARSHSRLTPIPVLRKGAGYHDGGLTEGYCSAKAIRHALLDTADTARPDLSAFLPESSAASLSAAGAAYLTEQDFSGMLYYKLLSEKKQGFTQYADCSEELSNRIVNTLPGFSDYRDFCMTLKRKETTYSRIQRTLLHILLEITDENIAAGRACGFVPYLRLLGFRRDASAPLSQIKDKAKRPLLTKPAKAAGLLNQQALSIFERDVFASDLYYGALAAKTGMPQKQEYRREMVIL